MTFPDHARPAAKPVIGFLCAFAVTFVLAAPGHAESIRIVKKLSGTFLTNVAGSSVTQPPYIQVIRSKDGLEYLLNEFERHKNRITKKRIDSLRSQLGGLDYEKHMLIGVFSQPMDNYGLSVDEILQREEEKAVEVKVSYTHEIKNPAIPPKKSVYFVFAVIPKNDYPVILNATEMVASKNDHSAKLITVTGRLMPLSGDGLQLVPVVIKRGAKTSYYIRGAQAKGLGQYVGRVVTLQGTVSRERVSPYEWDFTLKKVVKIFH